MEVTKHAGEKRTLLGKPGKAVLDCPMTDEERAELEKQVTDVSAESFAVEAEKKRVTAPLNERLKELKAREQQLVDARSSGVVQREVPVQRVADFFRGECWVERLDGEVPAEVPETRRALTADERQTLLPGVVRDGDEEGEAGQLLPLFPRRDEAPSEDESEERTEESREDFSSEEEEERKESEAEGEARRSPYQHPVQARPGESVFQLQSPLEAWSIRWPAVGLDVFFYDRGAPMGSAAWDAMGGEEKNGGWRRTGDSARIPSAVLEETAAAILSGDFQRPSHEESAGGERRQENASAVKAMGRDEDSNAFYPLPTVNGVELPDWKLAVGQGTAKVRTPEGDWVGPFFWSGERNMMDADDEDVSSEWMKKHEGDVLPALDELVLSGAVRESFRGYVPEKPGRVASGTHGEEDAIEESSAPVEVSTLSPEEARAMAEQLSGYSSAAVLALKSRGTLTASEVGVAVNTARPGMLGKRMLKDGLITCEDDRWTLTAKGESVASALAELESNKRKRKK